MSTHPGRHRVRDWAREVVPPDNAEVVPRISNPALRRRLTLARRVAVGLWAAAVVWRTSTSGVAFDRQLLMVYIFAGLIAASIGQRRLLLVVRDWLPFAVVLIGYDFSRGAAPLLGASTLWQVQPDVDRWLFFGVEPTVWLQEHLKAPYPPWWEVVISTVYMSVFIVPYAIGGIVWLRNRDDWPPFVKRFGSIWFIALAFYALVPAAPPWAAARCTTDQLPSGPSHPDCMSRSAAGVPNGGLLGAMHVSQSGAHDFVERISMRGWGALHLNAARALIDEGQASVNQVAAIPSVHAALSAMVAIFLWRRVHWAWRVVLTAYVPVMAFTLVYSAEHYVFDVLLGWALAAVVSVVVSRWEARMPPGLTGRIWSRIRHHRKPWAPLAEGSAASEEMAFAATATGCSPSPTSTTSSCSSSDREDPRALRCIAGLCCLPTLFDTGEFPIGDGAQPGGGEETHDREADVVEADRAYPVGQRVDPAQVVV